MNLTPSTDLDGPGAKINAMVALIGRLKSRGVPIDGVGSQCHLILGQVGGVAAQLQVLANTGLDVAITELDIRIPKPDSAAKLAQQQTDYNTVAKACISVSKCVGITVWGVSDKASLGASLIIAASDSFYRTAGSIASSPPSTPPSCGTITMSASLLMLVSMLPSRKCQKHPQCISPRERCCSNKNL